MRVALVLNKSNAKAVEAQLMIGAYLQSMGIDFVVHDAREILPPHPLAHCNLVVALGGDGTILHAASMVGTTGIPLLGLNFGSMGFLANNVGESVVACVAAALSGEAPCENRTNLRIDVVCEGEDEDKVLAQTDDPLCNPASVENSSDYRSFFAFNEVSLSRGASGHIIDCKVDVSEKPLYEFRGDGLIIASATGSTGYALSAGGPVVAPCFNGMIVMPLAAHTLRARALLTDAADVVEVSLPKARANNEALIFVDGEPVQFERPIVKLYVRTGVEPTRLLRTDGVSFYEKVQKTFL